MTNGPAATNIRQAENDLTEALTNIYLAEVRARLANLPGLQYAALDQARTLYVVTYNGREIGTLQTDQPGDVIADWLAYPAGTRSLELGPFLTARQAAAALLSKWTPPTAAPPPRQPPTKARPPSTP